MEETMEWYEFRIEYAVISERLGTSQETRLVPERRILPATDASLAQKTITKEIELLNNYLPGSLRFLNTHTVSAPSPLRRQHR